MPRYSANVSQIVSAVGDLCYQFCSLFLDELLAGWAWCLWIAIACIGQTISNTGRREALGVLYVLCLGHCSAKGNWVPHPSDFGLAILITGTVVVFIARYLRKVLPL